MFALSELWQLTDPNLKVEQDLCFGTLEKREKGETINDEKINAGIYSRETWHL